MFQTLFQKIAINVFGHVLIWQSKLKSFYDSCFPSYIESVAVINTATRTSIPMHPNFVILPWAVNDHQYYLFKIWHRPSRTFKFYMLKSNYLYNALYETASQNGITVVGLIPVNDLVTRLDVFVNYNGNSPAFAILINDVDVTEVLHPYLKCLAIPRNATALVVYMLHQQCIGGNPETCVHDPLTVKVLDFNLEEESLT